MKAGSKDRVIQIIDRLLEIHSSISKKEIHGSSLPELKQDLVDFRDVLTELPPSLIRLGSDLLTANRNLALSEYIMTGIIGILRRESVIESRERMVEIITSIDSKLQLVPIPHQDSKALASKINNTLVGGGLIAQLKSMREMVAEDL